MMKRVLLSTFLLMAFTVGSFAQRTTDKLDRGLVAIPANGNGNYISWRIFGEEYYDVEYNLYCNGTKLNETPLKVSNYNHITGNASSRYQVAAVVRGVEQELSKPVSRWGDQYIQFPVKPIYSRRGTNITRDYVINDIALADVDGDGVSEFLVKRNYGPDGSSVANDSAYNHIECYNLKGERLWYIDLGPNMVSGPDEQYDAVGYDWDGDGKAEVLLRGADNMIIHYADGTVQNIGNMNVNTRNTVTQTANMTYTNMGAEYLLYLEGATGKPYPIGTNGALWMSYPLPRGDVNDWGDGYGHRATKHYFGAPFLDGRHPFIFLGRGCYTKHHMKAFSVDPSTHKLSLYWEWSNNNGWGDPWYANGYHNFGIADVDWDGRDEICFGSMVIDDNGKGLSTTGLGHGDAQHCSDFDPYRHGQEIFACNEDEPAMNYRNATTSKIYYRLQSTADDGRALCGNFSNDYPGAIGHSSQSGTISCVADKPISGGPSGFTNNFRIYWDGDLLEEGLDGASSREGAARVFKANGSIVFTANGTANCNWTKNTPSATGDVIGDWREEIIVRTSDNNYIRVYTTNIYTPWRNYTLWHDHQYRQGMVWESMGYNQPPHASYFLGELENITVAPPPLTMTGRVEIANGGTIGAANNDQHVIVCETNDTQINVSEGAEPHIATFNVPSWVQGTNSTSTTNPTIRYTYYNCTVTGGGFAGKTRLVKQGDGTLNLPNVEQKHSGNTDVWAGVVNFDGTMKNSSLWLNRFAELNSNGGTFKAIKMDYDAKLRPGRADNKGTITTDSLLLGFGSRVIFDIYDDLSADQIHAKFVSIETKKWNYGPKYLVPVFEFVSHLQAGQSLPTGKYLIGEAENVTGNLSDIKIEGIGNSLKSSIVYEDGKLYLNIEGVRDATTVIWNGNENTNWDLATSKNFTLESDKEIVDEMFVTGDKVLFGDDANSFGVNLVGEIEADSIIVDNTTSYTFKGSGAIVGNSKLIKRGTGSLTILTDNTYTGGTRISGGTIVVSSISNSTQAVGNLGGVNSAASRLVIENGAELRTTAAVTQGSAMSVQTADGGVINNSGDYIVNRAISGTKLTKKGSGWMKLNVANTSLDRLVVAGGTVQCVSCNTPARTVEFQGGTLTENTSTSYGIYIPSGKSGRWNLVDRGSYGNKITGEGTLTIYCPVVVGSGWNATRTQIQGNWSEFKGTIKPAVHSSDTRFTLDNANGLPLGTMDIANGIEVQNSGRSFTIGKLSGTGSLGGVCSFSNSGGAAGNNVWKVGNEESWRWGGSVVGNGTQFVKIGSGKVVVSGVWTNTGAVTIQEGELNITSTASLGTGTLTVAKDAILSGVTTSSNTLKNSAYTINGTLQVGVTTSSYSGIMNFGSKNVSFSTGSTLVANVLRAANNNTTGGIYLGQINRLTMNGTIVVSLYKSYTPQVGDSIVLWDAVSFTGNPQFDLPATYEKVNSETNVTETFAIEWDTSSINKGILRVAGITNAIKKVAVDGQAKELNDVYNVQGQLVKKNAQSLVGLPKGIYFWQGRKVVVK